MLTTFPAQTILPLQTANFLFKIIREPEAVVKRELRHLSSAKAFAGTLLSCTDALRLTLTYCSIEDRMLLLPLCPRIAWSSLTSRHFTELQARIHEAIHSVIASSDFVDDVRWFLEHVATEISARTNLHEFSTEGKLDHLVFEQEAWSQVVELRFGKVAKQALEDIRRIYEVNCEESHCCSGLTLFSGQTLRDGGAQEPETAWRTLTIPVELPSLNVSVSRASTACIADLYKPFTDSEPRPYCRLIQPSRSGPSHSPHLVHPTDLQLVKRGRPRSSRALLRHHGQDGGLADQWPQEGRI